MPLLFVLLAAFGISPQITPPLTWGEPFTVAFDHTVRYFQPAPVPTDPAVLCQTSPPGPTCFADTTVYNLLIDGATVQTLPVGQPLSFRVTGGLSAGPHTIAVAASNAVTFASSTVLSLSIDLGPPQAQSAPTVARTAPGGAGLLGQYHSGVAFGALLLTRTDATVNFDWAAGSPGTGVPIDNFSVRWTGFVTAPTTGNYTFRTVTDDGVRLWVNDVQVINRWVDQSATPVSSAPIAMTAGVRVPVRLEYYERGSAAVARLQWVAPGGVPVAIPASALSR
jgi:hypothetical protein